MQCDIPRKPYRRQTDTERCKQASVVSLYYYYLTIWLWTLSVSGTLGSEQNKHCQSFLNYFFLFWNLLLLGSQGLLHLEVESWWWLDYGSAIFIMGEFIVACTANWLARSEELVPWQCTSGCYICCSGYSLPLYLLAGWLEQLSSARLLYHAISILQPAIQGLNHPKLWF